MIGNYKLHVACHRSILTLVDLSWYHQINFYYPCYRGNIDTVPVEHNEIIMQRCSLFNRVHILKPNFCYCPDSTRVCCCLFRCSGTCKRFSNPKETSCLPLLHAGFEPRGSLETNLQQTECPLTNRLSYRGSSLNLNSTARPYSQRAFSPLGPHCRLALAPGSDDIHVCYC